MVKITVFPDYCSSGLWNEAGANMDEREFEGVLSTPDLMALKYWHCMWEFHAEDFGFSNLHQPMTDSFWNSWSEDGKALVDAWNSKQDVFQFVYSGDYWK